MNQLNQHVCTILHRNKAQFGLRQPVERFDAGAGDAAVQYEVNWLDDRSMKTLFANIQVTVYAQKSVDDLTAYVAGRGSHWDYEKPLVRMTPRKRGDNSKPRLHLERLSVFKWWHNHPLAFHARAVVFKPEPRYFTNGLKYGEINTWPGFALARDDCVRHCEVRLRFF